MGRYEALQASTAMQREEVHGVWQGVRACVAMPSRSTCIGVDMTLTFPNPVTQISMCAGNSLDAKRTWALRRHKRH